MTVTNEQPRPVVRTGARFHADRARRQRGDQLVQLRTRHARTHELRLAGFIDAVGGKHVLGKIDADGENGHALPLPSELMRARTSHRGTSMPVAATRLARDGEVPFRFVMHLKLAHLMPIPRSTLRPFAAGEFIAASFVSLTVYETRGIAPQSAPPLVIAGAVKGVSYATGIRAWG
jgi:hypothetical protein